MKSTYKLFGTIWDGLECSDFNVKTITDENFWSDKNKNIITFTQLLSIDTEDELQDIVSSLQNNDDIFVLVDYWINNRNAVLERFLNKRLSQMVTYLSKLCNLSVTVARQI